jgi:hypothetical protein
MSDRSVVLAVFGGRCGVCDQKIVEDQDMITLIDDEWVHEDCAEEEEGEQDGWR